MNGTKMQRLRSARCNLVDLENFCKVSLRYSQERPFYNFGTPPLPPGSARRSSVVVPMALSVRATASEFAP